MFDSGIGGKLIAEKISKKIPEIEIVIRSDPEYFPYGVRFGYPESIKIFI